MKKHIVVGVVGLALLTAGCQEGSSSLPSSSLPSNSTSSMDDSSSSSSSSPIVQPDNNIQAILELIDQAKASTNYSYGYLDEDGNVLSRQLVTPSYIVDENMRSGTFALESYANPKETLLYSVEKQGEDFRVLNALNYQDPTTLEVTPYHETKELDYLALLDHDDVLWNSEVLYEQSGYYLVDELSVVTVFANMFGLGNYVDYVMRILFTYDAAKAQVTVGFVPNFTDTDGSISALVEGTVGYIDSVGQTEAEDVQAFIDSFSLSADRLKEGNLSYLTGDLVSYESNLTIYLDDAVYSYPSLADFQFDLANDRYHVTDYSTGAEEETYYAKGKDGLLVEQFIGPDNALWETSRGVNYEVPDFLSALDYDAFVHVEGNTYRYYGYRYDNLVKALTGAEDGMGVVTEMLATTDSQGTLETITARSRDVVVIDGGTERVFHYEMTLSFREGEEVDAVESHKDPADSQIAAALERFSSSDGYSVTTYRQDNTNLTSTWTVQGNIALLDEVTIDTAPGSGNGYYHAYSGYAYNPGTGLVSPFRVNEEGIASYYDDGTSGYTSIDDFFGFTSLTAEVLTFKDEETIVAKDKVRLLGKALPLGPNGSFALESTLTIDFDPQAVALTGYSYKTDGLGTDKARIQTGATLPESIDFSTLETPFVAPTSWEEGCPDIYEAMKAKSWIGEYADEIPYLYDALINDCWFAGNPDGILEFPINNNYYSIGSDYNVAYVEKYIDLLFEKGYTIGQSEVGYERYGKEGLPFVIMIDSRGATGMIQITIKDAYYFPFVPVE